MRRALVALLIAGVLATSCGVPLDDTARPIVQATTTTTPVTTTPDDPSSAVLVYYVEEKAQTTDGDSLKSHVEPVADDPTVRKALTILFTAEVPPNLKTSIPKGTDLIAVDPVGAQVTINLSNEIDDVTGDAQRTAYAQMVFTVLAFPQFTSVRFSIEGNPVEAPTDGANRSIVRASDYKPPLNPN